MKRLLLSAAPAFAPFATFAHDGHGLAGAHWHATDSAGFLLIAVAAGVLVWLGRKK